MLSALLLAGLLASPIATAGLFVSSTARRGRAEGWLRALGRLGLTLAWTVVLVAAVCGLLLVLGATDHNIEAAAAGLVLFSVLWLPVTRRWNARAHVCWSVTTYVFVMYLAFMLWWTLVSSLGPAGTAGGIVLWVLELFAAVLGCAYLWELCDALGRASWLRRMGPAELAEAGAGPWRPMVSLHVPCHNEPPDMVIETVARLLEVDYPDYEVLVIDDNTDDEDLWRPVESWCAAHGVKFVHLSDWPGYKSGALNYALHHMMDERAELIGVVDSDYQIAPDFLRRCVPLFTDPSVGFIQAPQDYRDWEGAPFYRRLYYSYQYFFAVSQPSRNERDGAIFAGTMGLIRRAALEAVGGWDEWCITEDAELSLRLLREGWSGVHVDQSFGQGIMPLTFEALKGQRFRWCFGGIQILRRHWRSMLPGRPSPANHLDLGQRWAYLSGAVQWYGDLLALLFFGFLLVGAGNIAFGGGLIFRKLTGFLLAAIPLLVVLGLLRAVALLRRGTGASWRDAFGAFFIWQSTGLTVARASVQALFAKEAAFLRTPKTLGDAKLGDALRANLPETSLGILGLAAIAGALWRSTGYGSLLIAALLVWPTASFLAALSNSISAQRAALPPALDARRRTEYRRYGARRVTYTLGGLGLAGGAVALAVALLAPGPTAVVPPQLIGPAQGVPVTYGPGGSGATGGNPLGTTPTTRPPATTAPPRSSTTTTSPAGRGTTTTTGHPATTTTAPARTTTTTTRTSTTTSTTTTTTTTTTAPVRTTTTTATGAPPTTTAG